MTTVTLTSKRLQTLKPPSSGRLEYSDSLQRGLKFRLTENGIATWSIQLTVAGRKRRFTIGPYPEISLSDARDRAAKLRLEVLDGRDPVDEKRRSMLQAETTLSVRSALEAYNSLHLQPTLRTAAERRRQLEHALSPHIDEPLEELSRVDLQQVIDKKAKTAPVAANRIRAGLSAFIGWCWRRGYVDSNFALATTRAAREIPRERVLAILELQAIWSAAGQIGDVWGPYLKLLLLTAQRRGDVAKMEWRDVDLENKRWQIPGTKTKNRRPHTVHLSEQAIAILTNLAEARTSEQELVFSTTGTTPISGFGRMKSRLDEVSGVHDWRLHDIRTAFATHLADRGFDESIVDRVLNHVASASSASTVARVYNRAERLQDRAEALTFWGDLLILV